MRALPGVRRPARLRRLPAPAEALRDAVSSLGWVPKDAALPVPAPAAARALPSGAREAFDAVLAALEAGSADALGRAARDAAAAAPPARRAAVLAWAEAHGASPASARAHLDALALALGLAVENAPDEKILLAGHDAAARRAAAVSAPDFGTIVAAKALPEPAALRPERPALPSGAEALLRERLGQSGDLAHGAGNEDELARLERLIGRVNPLLPDDGPGSGAEDARESRWASIEALRRMFDDAQSGSPAAPGAVKPDLAGTPAEDAVEARVARVEALNAELQAGLAARDAADAVLAVADRSRAAALRERRGGREMLEFRKNFARLAMVMDLSYSLSLLNSADEALGKMQALVERKLEAIERRRTENGAAAGGAGTQAGRADEWRREAEAQTAEDLKRRDDFASLSVRVGGLAAAVVRFRADVSGLLASIDARDRGRSADAPAEYARRLALLPALRDALIHGSASPSGVSDLSLDYLQAKSAEVADYRRKLAEADARIGSAPVEFAGVLVVAVPGVPAETVANPTREAVLALLARRRDHWRSQYDEHVKLLDAVRRAGDPSGTTRVVDDFGDSRPESLAVWRRESLELEARLKGSSDSLAEQADEIAALIEKGAPGAALPRLKGKSAEELRTALTELLDRLEAAQFPETDAGFEAKTRKIDLSRLIPFLGDLTARRLEAAATAKALEKPVAEVLPKALAAFTQSVAGLRAVLDDVALDEAWVASGGSGQALIDRKRALVSQKLGPMLDSLQDLLDGTLIPFQRDRISQSDPSSTEDGYATLYKEKKNLYERISDGLRKALPWGLASNGAKAYDASAARAGIATVRVQYEDYRKIVTDYQDSMRRRRDPNNMETEDLYGERVPYSLVRRAAQYREERRTRAARMNALAGEVADILRQMDALTGKDFAARYKLPADLDAESPATGPRLTAMADGRVLQNMAADVKAAADAALAAGGGTDLAVGGGSGIPTGTQPPLDVSTNQRIALLGLEAVKRLVPTTNAGTGNSYAECLARFLFADALVTTSDDYLRDRIPVFEAFLGRAAAGLAAAVADLDADLAWVGGELSGGEAVLDRKASIFERLATVTREGADLFGQKAGWSAEGVGTVGRVQTYYDTLGEVYRSGDEALDAERKAALEFRDALDKSRRGIQEQRSTVVGWLRQLDDPNETALARVGQNISAIQDRTRTVLETNIEARRAERARRRGQGRRGDAQGARRGARRARQGARARRRPRPPDARPRSARRGRRPRGPRVARGEPRRADDRDPEVAVREVPDPAFRRAVRGLGRARPRRAARADTQGSARARAAAAGHEDGRGRRGHGRLLPRLPERVLHAGRPRDGAAGHPRQRRQAVGPEPERDRPPLRLPSLRGQRAVRRPGRDRARRVAGFRPHGQLSRRDLPQVRPGHPAGPDRRLSGPRGAHDGLRRLRAHGRRRQGVLRRRRLRRLRGGGLRRQALVLRRQPQDEGEVLQGVVDERRADGAVRQGPAPLPADGEPRLHGVRSDFE
ncbi:MAG: hypothetical protein M0D55_11825 [Elusimicrobiota bacterium]|nr:MAG: hypothetical protein M0D55_11825 [Elusimicrobiota bacterium]